MHSEKTTLVMTALLLATLLSRQARAIDRFEIQVYEPDMNKPGQFGLELHSNYTVRGSKTPEYEGQVAPDHVARFTLEPAYGVTKWLELGAYLQAMVAPDVGAKWGGLKFRTKFVLPYEQTRPWFLGINLEVGQVPKRVEEAGWANEFRPLLGFNNGYVLVDVNPIFGYALSGGDKLKPDFEPAGKVSINTQRGFAIGAEYYSSLGLISKGFESWGNQEHMLFGTFDLVAPAARKEEDAGDWELNVGVGRALTSVPGPEWLVKAIVGRAF
jgi:hypothetical protein